MWPFFMFRTPVIIVTFVPVRFTLFLCNFFCVFQKCLLIVFFLKHDYLCKIWSPLIFQEHPTMVLNILKRILGYPGFGVRYLEMHSERRYKIYICLRSSKRMPTWVFSTLQRAIWILLSRKILMQFKALRRWRFFLFWQSYFWIRKF